jgi:cation diffusion facilitator CzcD-associated flavoprotein CzcO
MSTGNLEPASVTVDVAIVGAGIGGMVALWKLRSLGLSVRIFEAGEGVGGTWYWNRYPGARCDTQSLFYSYSFSDELQQEWHWSERYAAQPEIERYLNHVADRFDLRRDIQFGTSVRAARWNEEESRWLIETSRGQNVSAQFCVMATGGYSAPIVPSIPGLTEFRGELYYTSDWPREAVNFAGKRVGIIGTGSSGMQVVETVAYEDSVELYVFQRTANFCVPSQNRPMDAEYEAEFKRNYEAHRQAARASAFGVPLPTGDRKAAELSDEELRKHIDEVWEYGGLSVLAAFPDLFIDEVANGRVADYLREYVRERVRDPEVAELLCPKGYFLGERRLLVVNSYLEAFNKPNVQLVDVRTSPIESITATGVETTCAHYDLDVIVLATGFDAGTGTMLRIDLQGTSGTPLTEVWADGPRTFLGLMVPSFPNLFMLWGPGSPGIRGSGTVVSEQQVGWIARLIGNMSLSSQNSIAPSPSAADEWTHHVAEVAASGIFTRNETQFVGANVPGKPRVYLAYLGGQAYYSEVCDSVAREGYAGFILTDASGSVCERPWSGLPSRAYHGVAAM